MHTSKILAGSFAAVFAVVTTLAIGQSAQAATTASGVPVVQPIAGFAAAHALATANPKQSPPGVNDSRCHLTKAHPRPVVLINGTFTVMLTSYGYIGPVLANAGYCVYGYNFGGDSNSAVQATGPVLDGVTALANEVKAVKAKLHVSQVDLVGYSQGGLIAEYYTKFGGAASVHSVTGIGASTHGTTASGIGTLAKQLPGGSAALAAGCAACNDQINPSAVVNKLDTGAIAVKGVVYTIIDTRLEDVVTPVGSAFIQEPGVVNRYVQDVSPTDTDDHNDMTFDSVTASMVLTALQHAKS